MLIIAIRTDKPEAEIGLYDGNKKLANEKWQAHRQLAETLHSKLSELLQSAGKDWADVKGIVVYKGPGSFTGLRIGISVANTLAYSLKVPVIGASGDWIEEGTAKLLTGAAGTIVLPEYGGEIKITPPAK